MPVLHVVSSQDEVIPPALTQQVIGEAGKLACTSIKVVNGLEHNDHWEKLWPVVMPRCGG